MLASASLTLPIRNATAREITFCRPGRGGNIGTDLVAKAAPDGYTLIYGGMGSLTLAPFLTKLPYDALRDFAPVMLTAHVSNAIAVHPSRPVRSVKGLIALA